MPAYNNEPDYRPLAEAFRQAFSNAQPPDQNTNWLQDVGTSFGAGVLDIPGQVAGILDIPLGGLASEAGSAIADFTGLHPSDYAAELRQERSPGYQQAQQEADAAQGVLGTLGAYLRNPELIASGISESVPSMVLGGALGRGILAARGLAAGTEAFNAAAPLALGAGEGLVSAGQQQQGLLQAGVDPLTAAAASIATGIGVGALSGVGASIAKKMGLVTPEGALVGLAPRDVLQTGSLAERLLGQGGARGVAARAAGGAGIEGLLEEAPQSAIEQTLQNLATGRPASEGVPEAATQGAILGGIMGGVANIRGEPAGKTPNVEHPPAGISEPGAVPNVPAVPEPPAPIVAPTEEEVKQYTKELSVIPGVGPATIAAIVKDGTQAGIESIIEKRGKQLTDRAKEKLRGSAIYKKATGPVPEPAAVPTAEPAVPTAEPAAPVSAPTAPKDYAPVDVAKFVNNKEEDIARADKETSSLFSDVHKLLREYDNLGDIVGSEIVRLPTAKGGKTKAVSSDFDIAAIERGIAEGTVTAEKAAALEDVKVLNSLKGRINNTFAKLDERLGEGALQDGIAYSKKQLSKEQPKESSEAVRFSQLYGQYEKEKAGKQVDYISKERYRHASQIEKEYPIDPNAPKTILAPGGVNTREQLHPEQNATKLETIITSTLQDPKNNVDTPLGALLHHISASDMHPVAQTLASHFDSVLRQSKKRLQAARGENKRGERGDTLSNVRIVIHNQAKGPRGQNASVATERDINGKLVNSVHLWGDGQNPKTILHEVDHLVTNGLIDNPTTENQKAVVADLHKLRDYTVGLLEDDPDMSFGYILAAIKANDKSIANPVSPARALKEFSAYGKTDSNFINWMKKQKAPPEFRATAKNLWQVFASKMKALIGVHTMQNSLYSAFIDSSSTLLGESYLKSNKPPKAASKAASKAGRTELHEMGDEKPKVTREAALAAVEARSKVIAAALEGKKQEKATATGKPVVSTSQLEAQKRIRARREARSQTAITAQVNKPDRGFISVYERKMLDGLTNFLFGGKYKTWEEFAKTQWDSAGNAIKANVAKENPVSKAVGTVLGSTVDKFGTTDGFKNDFHNLVTMYKAWEGAVYDDFEALVNLSTDMQTGMLLYSELKDEKRLMSVVQDEDKVKTIKGFVAKWEQLRDIAIDEGRLDKALANAPMSRFVDVYSALDRPGFRVPKGTIYTPLAPARGENTFRYPFASTIGPSHVLDKNGVEEKATYEGKWYDIAGDPNTGDVYYVDVQAPQSVYDSLNIAKLEENVHPYYVAKSNNIGELYLQRTKTVGEQQADWAKATGKDKDKLFDTPKRQATAVSAAVTMMQEWAHTVQGSEILDTMLASNVGIAEEDKYISEYYPTFKGAPLPSRRVIDFSVSGSERNSESNLRKLRIPGYWVKLDNSPETRKIVGPMVGKYMAGPAYMAMRDYMTQEPIIKSKVWRALLSTFKRNKTIFSTSAHVNNLLGNALLSYFYDIPSANINASARIILHSVFPKAEKMWKVFPPSWREPLTEQERAIYAEMVEGGMTIISAKAQDFDVEAEHALGDFIYDHTGKLRSLIDSSAMLHKAYAALGKTPGLATDIYANVDNVFRLAKYMTVLQDARIKGESATLELKQRAAKEAREAFVDYQISAPMVRFARETAFPFIAWPYRMVPMLLKTMFLKPWKAANMAMAIYTLNAMAYAALGADDDDEEYERSLQPDWYQDGLSWLPGVPSNIRLPFSSSEGNAFFLNLKNLVPLGNLFDTTDSGTPQVALAGGPAPILNNILSNYDPFTGREITNGTEDAGEALSKRLVYLGKATAPGVLTSIANLYKQNAETGPLGYDYNFWVNLAKVAGVSNFQMNKPEAAYYKDLKRVGVERDFKASIRNRWRHELRQRDPDFEDAYHDVVGYQQRMMQQIEALANG